MRRQRSAGLLLTLPRWTPKRPPRRIWMSSLAHRRIAMTCCLQRISEKHQPPVPRLGVVGYATVRFQRANRCRPRRVTRATFRAQPMCASRRPLALPARRGFRRRIACRGALTPLPRARSDRGPVRRRPPRSRSRAHSLACSGERHDHEQGASDAAQDVRARSLAVARLSPPHRPTPNAGCEGVGVMASDPGTLLPPAGRGSYPWPDHP